MKRTSLLIFALALALSSCNENKEAEKPEESMKEESSSNPLLMKSDLPYQAPDFSKITNAHFKPALLEGIKIKKENVEKIAQQKEEATFENTIVALEKSGEKLSRVRNVFSALSGAHTNDTLQDLNEEFAPKFSELEDAMHLNKDLFARVKTLHDKKADLGLDAESEKLLDEYYQDFVIAGAELEGEDKKRLMEINSRLASLTTKFGKTLLAATNEGALIIEDKEELVGLSESQLEAIKTEDGKYRIPIQNTTQQPLLSSLDNRDMRKKV